jgi:ADP-heptose:LPS heptosyltransferase
LFNVDGVHFFSLQMGPAAADLSTAQPLLIDLAPVTGDMADTAAQIAQLDLVITVDTSVAHLAGALGKPTWVLLSYAPDWRWLLDREDSPWYPTMRLFRQPKLGDWPSVVEQVCTRLRAVAEGKAS